MSPGDEGVTLRILAPVATVVLHRPSSRNALDLASWRAIPSLIAAADREAGIRVILIRGAAGDFSSGNDIGEFGALPGRPEAAKAFGTAMASAMQSIERASKPVVVAIRGGCYGAAVALALAGDLRVAADDATFAITPAKLGAVYLRSDLHRLVNAVGVGQCKRLIYSAKAVGAAEAGLMGLVDQVFP